ncbi:MAG: ECF-type sigma factor [Phycisphaerales bacterium]
MDEKPPPGTCAHDGGAPGLVDAVYAQLRSIAQQRMAEEGAGHTLQATALVNEAYLRVSQDRRTPFQNRAHFFAAAAEAMRRILIDHARAKGAVKRGGRAPRTPLSVVDLAEESDPVQILALDEALQRLEKAEPEVAAVVRMRFFAGLSVDDTAEALGLSPRQVDRHWSYARAWLLKEVTG